MADDHEVVARFDLDPATTAELLLDFQAVGWVTRVEFAGTAGWTLREPGRAENERELAAELEATERTAEVREVYADFLAHNARLLRACTDWQLRPTETDPLAANDHTDRAWDGRVLDQLTGLGTELRASCERLTGVLDRFGGYDDRYAAALRRARQGEHAWVDRTKVDSCHTVWMELHEDLLATLGVERGGERAQRA